MDMEKNNKLVKLVEFEYLDKKYIGKIYRMYDIISILISALVMAIFISTYKALLAYFQIKPIEDIGFLDGDIKERILYGVSLCASCVLVYGLEVAVRKIYRGNKKVKVLVGDEVLEKKYVPMSRKIINLGTYLAITTVLVIISAFIVFANCNFMMGAIYVIGLMYGRAFVQSYYMKRLNCEYYISMIFERHLVGIKEDNMVWNRYGYTVNNRRYQ